MAQNAYVFPGQGSQTVGMGQALAHEVPAAADLFAEADRILGFSLSALCFGGPADVLTETSNAQPALLVTSMAALAALRAARPELPAPCCLAGHSLGEYSALVAAGALDFADGVRLTRLRGQLMAKAGTLRQGSMAAVVKLDDETVTEICSQAAAASGEPVQVANYNAPGQVVVSGAPGGVAAVGERVKAAGGRLMPLAVSVAAHSALMAPVAGEFAEALNQVTFSAPHTTVIGNVTARPLTTPDEIRADLAAQLTAPVRWTQSVRLMIELGADRFIEIGPGTVLTNIVKRIDANVAYANVAQPADITAI